MYGTHKFTQLSAVGDLLPFSTDADNEEYSGNAAIIKMAFSEALSTEKKKNPGVAKAQMDLASAILNVLWKPMLESRSNAQTKDRPMFNVPDFFAQTSGRGSSPIGNFSDF
jgi:hypothetical protein